ncbi:GspH/FimT family pseudopilin [Delftia sp. PS-11]|uniref:GspH/FimT family pseudopilin n=1 Tax=Delftia sp. PS-11 TaxID=2767222 RepID=UPI002457150D|nr:GspH/FimT family pseudopilin [Delftia sp. PS-11]KAJ8740874.1 GspH/FimT family pseudopilin [Delftia sp. PS-11]
MSHIRPPSGFTTIELMVTIAILAILAAMAAPSFTPIIERWRVRQTLEGLQSTLYYARSEAIRRGGGVILEKLPQDSNGCQLAQGQSDWGCGWVLYADTNGNARLDDGEEIRRMDTAARTTVTRTTASAQMKLDRWGNMGGLGAQGFTIAPYPAGISSPATRGLCVAAGGRIKVIGQEDVPCNS